MSYKESFLIPKSTFISLEEKIKVPKKKATTKREKSPINNKIKSLKEVYKKQRGNKQVVNELKNNKPETSIIPGNISKLFPREDQFTVWRIVDVINKSDKISVNPDTFELTIKGTFYGQSNLVDILSYFLGNADQFLSADPNNEVVTAPGFKIQVPRAALPFALTLSEILKVPTHSLKSFFRTFDSNRFDKVVAELSEKNIKAIEKEFINKKRLSEYEQQVEEGIKEYEKAKVKQRKEEKLAAKKLEEDRDLIEAARRREEEEDVYESAGEEEEEVFESAGEEEDLENTLHFKEASYIENIRNTPNEDKKKTPLTVREQVFGSPEQLIPTVREQLELTESETKPLYWDLDREKRVPKKKQPFSPSKNPTRGKKQKKK
jgi:hypothetical protein